MGIVMHHNEGEDPDPGRATFWVVEMIDGRLLVFKTAWEFQAWCDNNPKAVWRTAAVSGDYKYKVGQ